MGWFSIFVPDRRRITELTAIATERFPDVSPHISVRIFLILEEQFSMPPHSLTPTTRLVDDLRPDDLDAVELFRCIEKEFDLVVPHEDADGMITVADLVYYIQRRSSPLR